MGFINTGFSLLSSAVNQTAHYILPSAIETAITAGITDSRVGKIVAGIGLTISGLSIISATVTPKSLRSCRWEDITKANPTTMTKGGIALAGLALTCYGIYNLTMGILELTQTQDAVPAPAPEPEPQPLSAEAQRWTGPVEVKVLKLWPLDPANQDQCGIPVAKHLISTCPKAEKLWNDVNNQGNVNLKCVVPGPDIGLQGVRKRTIHFAPPANDAAANLILGYSQLKHLDPDHSLMATKCAKSVEEHVMGVERMDYKAHKHAQDIFNSCPVLTSTTTSFNWVPSSFKKWLAIGEETCRTDKYRASWYQSCDLKGLKNWLLQNKNKWAQNPSNCECLLSHANDIKD